MESYKQTHVKAAIEGVGNLRMGFWNQQMVPIKEMTDVLKVVKEVTNLKPKSWVRLKRGLYKDDIAQVRTTQPHSGFGLGVGGVPGMRQIVERLKIHFTLSWNEKKEEQPRCSSTSAGDD